MPFLILFTCVYQECQKWFASQNMIGMNRVLGFIWLCWLRSCKNYWALIILTWVLTIWTPCLSARKRYTKRVARMTEVIGAIAGTQKYFLFFFPCAYETSLLSYKFLKRTNIEANKKDPHNVLCKQKKTQESEANHNCLPVPLHIQNHALSDTI